MQKKLIARNGAQLDRCLRMIHREKVEYAVEVAEGEKGRIYFTVEITGEESLVNSLAERHRILNG